MSKSNTLLKQKRRTRRAHHIRNRIRAAASSPRLSIFRSSKHITAQVIDDVKGETLCAVSSTSKKLGEALDGKTKTARAAVIGSEIARLAREKGVERVVFDRGASKFHGRVKALADAAREAGLKF
ncbi:MAG: 50S ribosomal protein L18 [Planctomycetota bacterium]